MTHVMMTHTPDSASAKTMTTPKNSLTTGKKTLLHSMLVSLTMTLLALNTGCASLSSPSSSPVAAPVCDAIDSKQVDAAFGEARNNLSRAECAPYFEQNFSKLREVAQGDPGDDNRSRFAAWLNWSSDKGIITARQAKEMYTRYFHDTFVSLPSQGHVCGYLKDDSLKTAMKLELVQKREGYTRIAGDAEGFNRVHLQYEDMMLMLDSVNSACKG